MITKKQYRLMKSVLKSNGTTAQDSQNHKIYTYLASKGFLHKEPVRGYMGYVVTQDGEVEIRKYEDDIYRFKVTTTISLIALVTSIVSIAIGFLSSRSSARCPSGIFSPAFN